MIQALLIAAVLAIHLPELLAGEESWRSIAGDGAVRAGGAAGATGAQAALPVATVLIGGLAGMWVLVALACWRAGVWMDRRGAFQAYRGAHAAAGWSRWAGLALMVWCCAGMDWPGVVRGVMGDLVALDEWVMLLPYVVFLVGVWWAVEPLERRVREALLWRSLHAGEPVQKPISRGRAVLTHVRHQMLLVLIPLALLGTWAELGPMLTRGWREGWAAGAQWVGVLAIVVTAPAIVRATWDTVPIESGPFREMVERVRRKFRVRIRGPWLWRTHTGVANGAVLGLVYPFRDMLFTDGLLERMPEAEVEGVVAHEVAHVRRRHLPWLLVAVMAGLVAGGWIGSVLAEWVWSRGWLGSDPQFAIGVGSLVAVLAAVGTLGFVSRRFEWQADAFAVAHLSEVVGPGSAEPGTISEPAARTMVRALARVCEINGIAPARASFRHGSIVTRQRKLLALIGRRADRLPIDREVRWLKWACAAAAVAGLVPMIWPP